MVKKQVMVNLDEEVVEKIKSQTSAFGGSLSAIINTLLTNTSKMLEANDSKTQEKIKKNFNEELSEMENKIHKLKKITEAHKNKK